MRLGSAETQLLFALHKIVQERLKRHEMAANAVPRRQDIWMQWVETATLKKHVWMSPSYIYRLLDLLEAHRLIKRSSYGQTKRCRLTVKGKLWVAKGNVAEED